MRSGATSVANDHTANDHTANEYRNSHLDPNHNHNYGHHGSHCHVPMTAVRWCERI
jgi:hypothetical protein